MKPSIGLALLALLLLSCGSKNQKNTATDINLFLQSSSGVRFLIASRKSTNGKLILLLPGGDGRCHFGTAGEKTPCGKDNGNAVDLSTDIWVSYNFLARNLIEFTSKGHIAILVDMPEDVKSFVRGTTADSKLIASAYRVGGDWDFDSKRERNDVVEDLGAVISYVKAKFPSVREVYIVGTSRGVLASAYVGGKLTDIAGVVLTASVSSDPNFPSYCPWTTDFVGCTELNVYTGKLLMVHHEKDNCRSSTYRSAFDVYTSFGGAQKHFLRVSGGSEISSNPCMGKTYHGFWGKDREVVNLILNWTEGKPIPDNI